jgi:cell division protein FtsB
MRVRHVVLIAVFTWFLSNLIWAFVYVEDHIAARRAQIEQAQYPSNCPVSQ